jgi:hypothetical protein
MDIAQQGGQCYLWLMPGGDWTKPRPNRTPPVHFHFGVRGRLSSVGRSTDNHQPGHICASGSSAWSPAGLLYRGSSLRLGIAAG